MAQNILLIQANATDAAAVRNALSRSNNVHVEWVDTCALGLRRLAVVREQGQPQTAGFSAVLVDLQLPDAAGIEAFDRLYAAYPHIPICILSSTQDEGTAKLAIQRGAQDYLLKGRLDDHLLPKAIAGMIDRAIIAEALFDEKERAQVTLNYCRRATDGMASRGRAGSTTRRGIPDNRPGYPCRHTESPRPGDIDE